MENIHYALKVLKALLYLSSQDSEFVLPTPHDATISEVVNGTISHVGGNAGQYGFVSKRSDPEHHKFRNKLWRYFERELETNGEKLNPKVREALVFLTKKEGHWTEGQTGLEILLSMSSIGLPREPSSASMPYKTVMQIQRKVLPSFSEAERKDLEGIATCMKPFIEEDLEDIRAHYHW